jgi:hypothetical protein
MKSRVETPPAFKTRRDIERYFGGKTIECLLCRQHFRRLGGHLAAKHEMSVDRYRSQFGLPWTRGLTSAASVASSGWTDERKAKARKLAGINRFFERAHLTPRRAPAPFLKAEAVENLGKHAQVGACGVYRHRKSRDAKALHRQRHHEAPRPNITSTN